MCQKANFKSQCFMGFMKFVIFEGLSNLWSVVNYFLILNIYFYA